MRRLIFLLRFFYVLYALILFVALMVPVFVWALLVSPLGYVRSGNLIYYGCMVWADIWYPMIGVWHQNRFEVPLQKDAASIYVANHISYFDIPSIVKVFRHPVRPLGKAQGGLVPVWGFIYKKVIVSVDRSNAQHRAQSVKQLKSLLKKGISVLVFPEGTFNETGKPLKSFYDGAFRIAIETGAPIRPVLMLDTYDRMHYRSLLSLTPGRNRAIFLEPFPTAHLSLQDLPALRDAVHARMEKKLKEYGASWIVS